MLYPNFFGDVTTAMEFLERVEDHIHIEVRKLYSEADAAHCNAARATARWRVNARQVQPHRPMAMLAQGLIELKKVATTSSNGSKRPKMAGVHGFMSVPQCLR